VATATAQRTADPTNGAALVCCVPLAESAVTPDQAEGVASIFKALADPHRIRIVNLLANAPEPVCVCELMPRIGLSQGTVSFHLKKLFDVGLLEREQRGTWAFYSLRRDVFNQLGDLFAREVR
jgi:ArsR family transcriptional regulator, arsenate/arsenite/antimonite-responsive transcriptional repressor